MDINLWSLRVNEDWGCRITSCSPQTKRGPLLPNVAERRGCVQCSLNGHLCGNKHSKQATRNQKSVRSPVTTSTTATFCWQLSKSTSANKCEKNVNHGHRVQSCNLNARKWFLSIHDNICTGPNLPERGRLALAPLQKSPQSPPHTHRKVGSQCCLACSSQAQKLFGFQYPK